jgi:O-antigen ligase
MRNPITGLGPAAYRSYARMKPLAYGRALWVAPTVNSHNNYVDLFSQVGLVGLGIFLWFAIEVTALGFRLRSRSARRPEWSRGFVAGYVNGMLAAWAGSLALMLFADYILPFVYNIGFPGFQASVLVWLYLGGLVSLDALDASHDGHTTMGADHAA